MWFSLSEQTAYFLWSIALGAAAAALYDLFRAARILLKAGRAFMLVGDILFFVLCGIITSLFSLPFNKGSVRAFIVFGEAVGFLCCRLTVGTLTGRFYSILSKAIARISEKICELLKKFFDLLLKIASRVVYNVGVVKDKIKTIVSDRYRKRKVRRRVMKNSPPKVRTAGEHGRSGRRERNRKRNEGRNKKRKRRKTSVKVV